MVAAEGSRYLAVTVDPADPTPVSLRVAASGFPGLSQYVDASGHLTCDPIVQTPGQWGTVHVTGSAIIPQTEYLIQSVCENGIASAPIAATTWRWGDGNNNDLVEIDDILCVLAGFAGHFTNCSQYAVDFKGVVPNGSITLDDILAVLDAFGGGDYHDSALPPVPAPPVLVPYTTLTNQLSVLLGGVAPDATFIEISSAITTPIVYGPLSNGVFSGISFPLLQPNRVNQICITGIRPCPGQTCIAGVLEPCTGVRSAPSPAVIIHDAQPPILFFDSPVDNAVVIASTTDISGRVGDILSGFMGLSVMVDCPACGNPIQADVDAGIGPNGTFYAANVPLNMGPNQIVVTAKDYLQNEVTTSITVTRGDFPPGAPQLQEVSGNGQDAAEMNSSLPEPIVVRVTESDGITPIVNKVVTFSVTRSDGRLFSKLGSGVCTGSGTMRLQCHTDTQGLAEAYWTLGSDAGCGNNRVEVTSTSIAGTVMFSASATSASPHQINVGSGNNQRAEVGSPAHEPLRVWVNDSCNGVDNEPVTFSVTRGGGLVNGQSSVVVSTGDTGHAQVDFTLGPNPGNNVVEATYATYQGRPAVFTIYGVARNPSMSTSLSGVVLDNAHQPIGGSNPAEARGVRCSLTYPTPGEANPTTTVTLYTDVNGQFKFDHIPTTGPVNLEIDGSTADRLNCQDFPGCMDTECLPPCQIIPMNSFPKLHFMPVLIPNAENTLPVPVLLPKLNLTNERYYSGSSTEDLELTVEGVDGLKMIVKAGTTIELQDGRVFGPSNPRPIALSLNQVHHDDIPMPIPDGAAPPFAWTLQPGGAKFDKPIEIEYPNMSGLPPGALSNFLTFNHDTNRFGIFGTGRVSNDGSMIKSDPGVGITTSGWGCNCPPYSVTGDCCSGCGGSCCDGVCCGGECSSCSYCCNGSCCSHACTICVDNGHVQDGEIIITPRLPCMYENIYFTLTGFSDSGGFRKINCEQPDPLDPTNSFFYTWQITKPSGIVLSGSNVYPQAVVFANEPGIYYCSITATTNRPCPASLTYGELSPSVGPGILSATEWLVVHDPTLEVLCQQGRCKQAELMMNEAIVTVQKPDGPCGEVEIWLVDTHLVNKDLVMGHMVASGDEWKFYFRTIIGGGGTAKTDSNGRVYVEGTLLPGGITGGWPLIGPDYVFEMRVDGVVRESRDLTINPLLHDLTYSPNVLASPPVTLDPYSNYLTVDSPEPIGGPFGYDLNELFGLGIYYRLYDDVQYPPQFLFYNDPLVPTWGGDQGIIGEYALAFDTELGGGLWSGGITQKTIKWEGFNSNSQVIDQSGYREQAARVFMLGVEAELPESYDMGDGVLQSARGVAPRYVVKEGNYVNAFKVKRQSDSTQEHRIEIPFEVKYGL